MKKILKFSFLLMLVSTLSLSTAMAQKFGHLNSGQLVSMMPESKAAEKELVNYKTQLENQLESKIVAFQKKISDLQARVKNMAPVDARQAQEKLSQEEQTLYAAKTEGEQKVMAKREELLTPILNKADEALRAVAQENGFTMIFDSGAFNVVLFAEETTDVMPLVKAKLGLK